MYSPEFSYMVQQIEVFSPKAHPKIHPQWAPFGAQTSMMRPSACTARRRARHRPSNCCCSAFSSETLDLFFAIGWFGWFLSEKVDKKLDGKDDNLRCFKSTLDDSIIFVGIMIDVWKLFSLLALQDILATSLSLYPSPSHILATWFLGFYTVSFSIFWFWSDVQSL